MIRNVFIIALLILVSCTSDQRTDFVLFGKVWNLNKAVFRIVKDGKVYDTDTVKNNAFLLQARATYLEVISVDMKVNLPNDSKLHGEFSEKWIRVGDFLVDKRSFYMIRGNGLEEFLNHTQKNYTTSKHQRQFDRLQEWQNDKMDLRNRKLWELKLVRKNYLQKGDSAKYNAYTDSIRLVPDRPTLRRNVVNDFLSFNPDTYLAIYKMSTSTTLKEDFDFYKSVYARLSSKLKDHKYAKRYKQRSDQLEKQK